MEQSDLYVLYDRDPGPIVCFLEHVRDRYDLPRPGDVLDMGCGPGRLLVPLAESDWDVIGYEPDPDYARRARKTVEGLSNVSVAVSGLLDLDEDHAFDLIAAVNGPYSYLLPPAERWEALERCARALRPGGVLFLEFGNFHWILKNYREPPKEELTIGSTRVTRTAHHVIDYHRGTFFHHDRFTWKETNGKDREIEKIHEMAIVSFPELAFFLGEVGFQNVLTFNSYADREPGDLEGRSILVTAQVPREGRASP